MAEQEESVDSTWIDIVEKRLAVIEKRILGEADKNVEYPKASEPMVDTLSKVQHQIGSSVAGRQKVEGVMKRMNELEHYLEPAYSDDLTMSRAAKAEVISTEEDFIRQQAADLEKVQKLVDVLASDHIKVVPSLQAKLHELNQVHLQQQDSTSELSEESKKLLLHYNNVVNLISKEFVQWDEAVTRLELASQTKKIKD